MIQSTNDTGQVKAERTPIHGLTEGRIVHYVANNDKGRTVHRPAIIVQVWDRSSGMSNLQVFTDGTNDGNYADGMVWRTSVRYSDDMEPGTWHFIEPA